MWRHGGRRIATMLARAAARAAPRVAPPTRAMASSRSALPAGAVFFLDAFAARQWAPGAAGTSFDPAAVPMEDFVQVLLGVWLSVAPGRVRGAPTLPPHL